MLAYARTYYNVPEAVRLDLEKVIQAVVTAWYNTAQEIYRLQTVDRRWVVSYRSFRPEGKAPKE